MPEAIQIGDHVQIFLDAKSEGWFEGTVIRIDPYSQHRSFYWVELGEDARAIIGIRQISVFNPKNIQKLP
jgi:hypothetical protein